MHPPSSCSKGSMRQPQTPLHLPRGWHAVCLVYVSGINSRWGDLLLIILINLCCWNPSKSCKWFALLCVQVGADHFRFLVQWQGTLSSCSTAYPRVWGSVLLVHLEWWWHLAVQSISALFTDVLCIKSIAISSASLLFFPQGVSEKGIL